MLMLHSSFLHSLLTCLLTPSGLVLNESNGEALVVQDKKKVGLFDFRFCILYTN